MRGLFTKQSFSLEAGEAISGVSGKAQQLRILRGRVWITVEGVSHDYWLSAGDSFPAMPGCLIVVEADRGGSRIDVIGPREPAMLEQFGRRMRSLARRFANGKAAQPGPQQCPLAHCPQQS